MEAHGKFQSTQSRVVKLNLDWPLKMLVRLTRVITHVKLPMQTQPPFMSTFHKVIPLLTTDLTSITYYLFHVIDV